MSSQNELFGNVFVSMGMSDTEHMDMEVAENGRNDNLYVMYFESMSVTQEVGMKNSSI